MVDPDRRPTAQEIEELIDLVRRDPASPAFIDLGEAYLSLGRPRDAIQIGNLGLEAAPDSLEGRVMLARAYASLHQWKEAQGELLRVVKVDRSNRQGFALLGEVLLRRNDFERAVPVLQHAQNLDPTSPAILSMLRRARAGQPLDPPQPIPQPLPPRGEPSAEIQRSGRPTAHAKPRPSAPVAAQPPPPPGMRAGPGYPDLAPMPHAPSSNAVAPTMALPPSPLMPPPPPQQMMMGSPPPFPDASSGNRAPKQTAPPPMSVEGVRPRLVQNAKPQNAAAASLRQSAAVGENYLNDLLTGGLLDVAGVRVPEVEYDLRPDRRWGRSTRRAFIFLFVVLVLGVGGGGTWYWWSENQKREAVATMQRESRNALGNADYTNIVEAIKLIQVALDKDGGDKLSIAYYVEACGLAALLYGEAFVPNPKDPSKEIAVGALEVDHFYKGIASGEDPITADQPGYREMMIGHAAAELSRLPTASAGEDKLRAASAQLQAVNKDLDALLDKDKNDRWARYLKGRVLLAEGDPTTAATMFKQASEGDGALVVAMVDHANVLVDQGKLDEALALYKKALEKSKDHPLALIGEAIAKGEASITPGDVIGELNAKFVIDKLPSRVAAWRWLALAGASIASDDYKVAGEAVLKSKANNPPSDPRFWSRVAWIHYKLGRPARDKEKSDVEAARDARKQCVWFSSKAAKDPTVQLVDAGLDLAGGLPDRTLEAASKLDGVRPKLLRAYALLDLGKAEEAMKLAQEIVRTAPEPTGTPCEADNKRANLEGRTLCEQARMLSTQGKERVKASEELTSLASGSKNQIPRHALGVAFLALKDSPPIDANIGPNLEYAKKQLKKAYEDITETEPNPLLYRTLTALAEVAVTEKDLDAARAWHKKALEANADYRPARAVGARIYLRAGDAEKALEEIDGVLREISTSEFLLTKAEALVSRKKVSADDKEEAKKLIGMLKDRPHISAEELGRIAALIDPKAPEELGLPSPDKKDDKKPPPRRGR